MILNLHEPSVLDINEREKEKLISVIHMKRKVLHIFAGLMMPLLLLELVACSGTAVSMTTSTDTISINLSDKIDANGVLLDDVEVLSDDGIAALKLPKGTTAVDAAGKPLTSIIIVSKFSLTPWYSFSLYKTTYEFQPVKTVFSQPVLLTFSYFPTRNVSSSDENSAIVGYLESSKSEWIAVPGVQVDLTLKQVSVKIDRLGTYGLFYPFPLS